MAKFMVRVMQNGEWDDEQMWESDMCMDAVAAMVEYAVKQATGEYPESIEMREVD